MKKLIIAAVVLTALTICIYSACSSTKAAEIDIPENPNEEMLIEQTLLEKANRIDGCFCEIEYGTIPADATVMVDFGDGILHYYLGGEIAGLKCNEETHKTTTVYWIAE